MSISSLAIRCYSGRTKLRILHICRVERGIAISNYVLLYSGGGMPETEAEEAAVLQALGVWYGTLRGYLVDAGKPFSGHVKAIAPNGTVSDGPVGSMASGYTIIKAASLDEAVAKAKGCPLLQSNGQ